MSTPMTNRRPPPRRGEARERILEEASALFQTRGFADVSMQQIADAAGITKAAMYYHFRSKEDLFAVVAHRVMNQYWGGIIERIEGGGPLRETLKSIVSHVLEIHADNLAWSIADDVRRHLPPEAEQAIFFEQPPLDDPLKGLFQRAIEAGEMRPLDVDAVVTMFLGMMMGLSHGGHDPWWRREPQPGDADLLVDVLLNGIASS